MSIQGKKIDELEQVTNLTNETVLPVVVVNNNIPETTAKKVTISQIVGAVPTGITTLNGKTGSNVVLTGDDINISSDPSTSIDTALSEKQNNPNIISDMISASITIDELAYNTIYQYGIIDSLTISALPYDYLTNLKRYDENAIYFTSGNSGTEITLPQGLSWINSTEPTIESNTKYVISICNGAVISGSF